MFCDLVGSTALASRLDPEDLREVIGAYHRCVAETVGRFEGFIAKYMGDGVLVYFGYPQAHEDDAERAVRAGLALIDEVGRLAASEPLRVRAGIGTGLVVVGDLVEQADLRERSVVGETPNLASRLQAMAEADAVVIGPRTHQLVGDLFEYHDLGSITVKGFAEPVHAYRVLRPSAVEGRFEALHAAALAPLVGRDEEIELLLRCWSRAREGSGQIALIAGEPGIGKSRLTTAVQEAIEAEPQVWLRYFCSPYHQDSALHPIINQLERASGFARDDTAETKIDKLKALLAPTSAPTDDVALLAEFLSIPNGERHPQPDLSPQRRKEKVFQALLRQLESLARQRPVLMIFEDLHWIDPTTQELLDLTVERVRHLSVLLLVTFRPEFQAPWTGQSHVTMLPLARLDRRDSETLIARIGNKAALRSEIVEEIVERTDGIPLFVEELTKAVLEAEAHKDHVAGPPSAAPRPAPAIPATLQGLLLARLDRLGTAAKETAQIGAAVGRVFQYELLAAIAPGREVELLSSLDQLVGAGLVFQRGAPPQSSYAFKHALVQDAAYSTLLRGPRRALHARIAAELKKLDPEMADTQPELLAHHVTEAGLVESAIVYWRKAGEQAVRRAANREAIKHFRRALSLNETRPDGVERRRIELAILSQLGPALMSVHGWPAPEVGAAFERAGEVARRLESSVDLAPPLVGLWLFHVARGQFARAEDISSELFRIARELNDSEVLLQAHHAAWPTRFLRGLPAEASEHMNAGMALYDERRHDRHRYLYLGHDPAVCALAIGAPVQWLLGYPERAMRLEREAVELARRLRHAPSLAHALWFVGECQVARGDVAAVTATATEQLALCEEHKLPQPRATALMFLGWALARTGEVAEGTRQLEEGLGVWHRLGARSYLPRGMCLLAESYFLGRRFSEGLEQVARALTSADDTGEHWYSARVYHVRAELLLQMHGRKNEAVEASLRTAVEIGRAQGARGWELRAVTLLARLVAERGERGKALDLLAPVYGGFTEGFVTPDLKDARAFLDELCN
jgi:class 3 adenylate cyclase/predicted ATPase